MIWKELNQILADNGLRGISVYLSKALNKERNCMENSLQSTEKTYIQGWKTWNVNSVLSYVYMPAGLTLNLCVKEYRDGGYLRETLIGRQGAEDEKVFPGPHGFGYTQLRVQWRDLEWTVETGTDGSKLVILITPLKKQKHPALFVLETGFSWNRPGTVTGSAERLIAQWPEGVLTVRREGKVPEDDMNIPGLTKRLLLSMDEPAVFIVDSEDTLEQAQAFVAGKKAEYTEALRCLGKENELYEGIICAMNWDTVYDAGKNRVISPVSRIWSVNKGGYMLFCWDNYFAGMMASLFDSNLAEANFRAITSEITADGFIPNMSTGTGQKTFDRSQPPVGSAMILAVYRRLRNLPLVKDLFPALLRWNRWFGTHRMRSGGALSWGSEPFEPLLDNVWETEGVNDRYGAALESGLDNSPMYDGIPFNKESHLLELEDVGLTGLYILDCRSLIELARVCGREDAIQELQVRLYKAEQGLEGLWNEDIGFYCNRRTDTGLFSDVLSPTSFYALFSQHIPPERLESVQKYYFDPKYFHGDYVLPSVIRCHPSYAEQDYWRGRIWAPMNYLVYLAARAHNLHALREDLAKKSRDLFLKEWRENRHIHENYSGDTGEGCDKTNSDRFYHWGALLAVIWLHEYSGIPAVFED